MSIDTIVVCSQENDALFECCCYEPENCSFCQAGSHNDCDACHFENLNRNFNEYDPDVVYLDFSRSSSVFDYDSEDDIDDSNILEHLFGDDRDDTEINNLDSNNDFF